nr:NAD(P)H-dependent oxidoreductase subunit E [uncultured Acetobacterium sp.]
MNTEYKEVITRAMEYGGILDAMLALQEKDGYLNGEAVEALGKAFNMFPSEVYDTATFYSMLRFEPQSITEILICRGAPCHVAGSVEVIAAIEKEIGIKIGEKTDDGRYSFDYTECLGQCQAATAVLINGKLHTNVTPEGIAVLLRKGGPEESWKK